MPSAVSLITGVVDSTTILYVWLGAGFLTHLLYFHHGEHHLYPYRIIQSHLLGAVALVLIREQYISESLGFAAVSTLHWLALYLLGLYTSTCIYRLFLNPLNAVRGPYLCRLTRFYYSYLNRAFDGHHELQRLHRKYGPFVRTGPNSISVIDPVAVPVISGTNSKCIKAEWYSNDQPLISLHTSRDRTQHDLRRRVWAPAFSPGAIKGYESRIQKYNDILIDGLSTRVFEQDTREHGQEGEVNVSELFNWYSFDVMSDLSFGKPFGCLQSRQSNSMIKLLGEGIKLSGLAFPEWFFRLLIGIPGMAKDYWVFIDFCAKRLAQRMAEHPENLRSDGKAENSSNGTSSPDISVEKDLTFPLIEHFKTMSPHDQQKALPMLQGDSRLIIIAGSDTTAATLVHLFYHLARDSKVVERIREEASAFRRSSSNKFEHQDLTDAEFLNGCIYETLRLYPPVPNGVQRKTPSEGVFVGKTFIPGSTTIQMPWFVMGRDEMNYVDAEQFRPDRWSAKHVSTMVKRKEAFQSFNSGPYGCIGRNLALMEIRLLTLQILDTFDVGFGEKEDGHALMTKTIEHFTMGLAPLRLRFQRRESE